MEFKMKKIVYDCMDIVKLELCGTQEDVKEMWKGLSSTIDNNYTVKDFFYPIEEGTKVTPEAETFPYI